MPEMRSFKCAYCGKPCSSRDARKLYCNKQCADRSRNLPIDTGPMTDLRIFSRLDRDAQKAILLGEDARFRVCGFDIEATDLKGNIGRILCCSFKPMGGDVYTFNALERQYRMKDNHDDSKLAKAIITELEKYDIIVGWNSKNFDVKYINARSMRGGGPTKEAQYHVDGMWAWRSKAAAWSGLASVQQFIAGGGPEKTTIDWRMWMRALGWDKALREAAMAEIIHHCELDVIVLENVYRLMVEANAIRSIRRDGGIL